jgi:hypothetical protein
MTPQIDKAVAYFNQGYNCAQSVAAAFAQDFGLDEGMVLKLTAGFGAGMGGVGSASAVFLFDEVDVLVTASAEVHED